MSTTRRGFLKLLGIGTVAAPTLLKAALKKPTLPVPVVTSGYMQVLSCGSGGIGTFDPANYIGEVKWESCDNSAPWLKTDSNGIPEGWWTQQRGWFPPTKKK